MSLYPAPIRPEIEALEKSRIQEVWELGFTTPDLIGMWVGEGDVPTPDFIMDPAIASLKAGQTFYTHKQGIPELRTAIADYSARFYGRRLPEEAFSVTQSGMHAVLLALLAILRPGEKVAVVCPIWPNIMAAVTIAGGQVLPVELESLPDGGFSLDLERLEAALDEPGVRALFIASPGNPTGWMMEAEEQARVLEMTRARGIWLIADEVYNRFTYDRPHAPSFMAAAEEGDALFVVQSFSKAWAMTGWRLGWLVHPVSLGEKIGSLIEFSNSGCQHFLQVGALAAIREGEPLVEELVERCRIGGEMVYQSLAGLPGIALARPRAAFYAFFAVEGMADSLAMAKRILGETGVGLAPGSAFGPAGEGHLRLCFASSHARLGEGLERLRGFFAKG